MDDKHFLKLAIEQARQSVKECGFPAGALVVKDGKVIAQGISIGSILKDPTSHAETAAIKDACKKLNSTNLDGAILYESLQSCAMCLAVAYWAGISKIVYACKKNPDMVSKHYYEGMTDNENLNKEFNRQIELVYVPDYEEEVLELIAKWEKGI